MTRRLIIRAEAQAEILQAFDWYESQRPGLGRLFELAVEAALSKITDRPTSFPRCHNEARRALLDRFPYAVVFIENKQLIEVIAVFHGSRQPGYWHGRISE